MTRKGPVDLSGMDRSFFEALSPEARVELLCRLHALAIEQAEKRDPSSRPPSSDGPFGPALGSSTGVAPPPPSASYAFRMNGLADPFWANFERFLVVLWPP